VLPVGEQVAEGLRVLGGLSRRAAWARALELLEEVRLDEAAARARRYPHELSGGQRQRVMLAIALALGPSLLIADEPTSALDAPVAAEIMALLAELRARREMALVLITHDLGVVRTLATRVAVLYAGRIVEEAGTQALFERAAHPYTVGLLRSRTSALVKGRPLPAIPGQVPAVGAWPGGCRFHPRCALADARCRVEEPRLLPAPGADRDADAAAPVPAVPELRKPDETLDVRTERVACHHAGEAGAP